MPTYAYKKPNGETVELVMRIHDMLKRQRPDGTIIIDDVECKRDYTAQRQGLGGLDSTPGWPIHSEALAGHSSQREEFSAFAQKRGVPTEHDADCRPILRNSRHRRDYCQIRGVIDRNAGYGDPM